MRLACYGAPLRMTTLRCVILSEAMRLACYGAPLRMTTLRCVILSEAMRRHGEVEGSVHNEICPPCGSQNNTDQPNWGA